MRPPLLRAHSCSRVYLRSWGISMARSFAPWLLAHVERRLHHPRGRCPVADLDRERGPFRRERGRHVREADRGPEGGALRPARHVPDLPAVLLDGVTMARDPGVGQREADELLRESLLPLPLERGAPDEVALVELH